jgi:cytochrome P450
VPSDFDPLAPEFARDPHAVWARLRSECPVARGARWDFWALTRYDDVVAASSRPGDFTSSQGIVVPKNPV